MATGTRIEDDRFQPEPPKKERTALQTCLIGCLGVFVVFVIIAAIGGFWVYRNWRDWVATAGSQAIKQGLEQSQLPEAEIKDIDIEVDRVAEAFRSGKLSAEKLAEIVKDLAESPLMTSIVASAVEAKYIAKSGLSDEEKTQATQTLRRFLRGVVDKKIDEAAVNTAMANVADREPNGNWKLREKVSDEDLKKFLETAKAEADKAEIPEEPEDFDPSDEVKRIVDEALQP